MNSVDKLASSLAFPTHIDKPVSKLSGGTKRKITLAISMIAPSRLLILDEPITGAAAARERFHVTCDAFHHVDSHGFEIH